MVPRDKSDLPRKFDHVHRVVLTSPGSHPASWATARGARPATVDSAISFDLTIMTENGSHQLLSKTANRSICYEMMLPQCIV